MHAVLVAYQGQTARLGRYPATGAHDIIMCLQMDYSVLQRGLLHVCRDSGVLLIYASRTTV